MSPVAIIRRGTGLPSRSELELLAEYLHRSANVIRESAPERALAMFQHGDELKDEARKSTPPPAAWREEVR